MVILVILKRPQLINSSGDNEEGGQNNRAVGSYRLPSEQCPIAQLRMQNVSFLDRNFEGELVPSAHLTPAEPPPLGIAFKCPCLDSSWSRGVRIPPAVHRTISARSTMIRTSRVPIVMLYFSISTYSQV